MDDTQKKEAGLKIVELAKKMGASDETLKRLADEIGCGESESTTVAVKIESTMQYPGTIKVNVIRETRAIEFAK